MTKITDKYFSGVGHVHESGPGGLSGILRQLLQSHAKRAADSVTDLTNNAGGSGGGNTVAAIVAPDGHTDDSTDSAAKAGFDTAWAKVRNAVAILAEQVNDIAVKVPAAALDDDTGGTASTNTIAAIGNTGSAVDGTADNAVAHASVLELLAEFKDRMATVIVEVNKLCVATGVTPLTNNLSQVQVYGTLAAMAAGSGAGVDATEDSTVSKTDADALLTAVASAITTVAVKLNAITDGTVPTISAVAA